MIARSAQTIAIEDQMLALLRDEYPVPISTMHICSRLGIGRYSHEGVITYRRLTALAARGVVERIRLDGMRSVYWRGGAGAVDPPLPAHPTSAKSRPRLRPAYRQPVRPRRLGPACPPHRDPAAHLAGLLAAERALRTGTALFDLTPPTDTADQAPPADTDRGRYAA